MATKAVDLKALGGSYGANNKPTRFLCLTLKLLQIQPEEGIVEEFLMNEDFKYVRALGAFYLRLTGRPAEIYEQIEPMYNDFRKLRFRTPTGWKITHVDEFADELLTSDRYCGIALPHLPKRDVLVSAGYLEDGPRRSALTPLIEEQCGGDAERLLEKLAENGNVAAVMAMNERKKRKREVEEKERSFREQVMGGGREQARDGRRHENTDADGYYRPHGDDRLRGVGEGDRYSRDGDDRVTDRDERYQSISTDKKKKKEKKDKKYGSLFKSGTKSKGEQSKAKGIKSDEDEDGAVAEDIDYWNAERAKLGLKPLKED